MDSVTVHAGGMTITSERGSIDLTREAVRQLYVQGKRWAEDDEIPNQAKNLEQQSKDLDELTWMNKYLTYRVKLTNILQACGIDLNEDQLMDETVFDAVVNRVRELCSSDTSKSSRVLELEGELERAKQQVDDYSREIVLKCRRTNELEAEVRQMKLDLEHERALVAKLQAVKPLVDAVDALKTVLNR